MSVKLFIGGFPLDMEEMSLAQLVAPHGRIEVMKIVRDKRSGVCKGYAFVEVATDDDAVSVMAALDGEMIGDRALSVKLADAPAAVNRPVPRYERLSRPGDPVKKKRPRRMH